MNNSRHVALQEKARHSYQCLTDALDWVCESDHAELSNNARLIKDFRRSIYQTRRLEQAASSKMCVGVYGASQAGKSYLVSIMARKSNERLIALMGGREIDFIRDVNPEGGKESTGLVTRFTIDALSTPEGFPVQVRLLSEFDLIKLFVNSYANDIRPDDDESIESHIERVQKSLTELYALPRASSPISVEDVYDLEDYCNSRFNTNFRIQALRKTEFWGIAAELMPVLDRAGRQRLAQILWEDIPTYSRLFGILVAELEALGHPQVLYCAAEALFDLQSEPGIWHRAADSIINVSALEGMGTEGQSRINVTTPAGRSASVSTPNLCALIAELVISMKDCPHPTYQSTDLLDFPGARSRKMQKKDEGVLSNPEVQVENFLRGKVAYLFDKYAENLELSVMLLCVGPSNQEVVGLDKLVEDWIIRTHGARPEHRDKLMTALFLVLTKFDTEFGQGAGKTADGTRWTTRLQASLINHFAAHSHQTNWVNKWNLSGPFNNTFWLRNPHADQAGLIEYEGTPGASLEIGYSQTKMDFIETLRKAFLVNPLVQQHFADPLRAWESGMALNDGGASYLIEKISEVCSQDVKSRQIEARLNQIIQERERDLKKYYVSGDAEELAREKREKAQHLIQTALVLLERKRIGEMISCLLLNDTDTIDVFKNTLWQVEREKNSKRSVNEAAGIKMDTVNPALAKRLGLPTSAPEPKEAASSAVQTASKRIDFPDKFLRQLIEVWRTKAIERVSASSIADYLYVDREFLAALLSELETAALRTGLVKELTELVEANYQYKSDDRKSWVWKQTAGVTARFNEFVSRGGVPVNTEPVAVEAFDGNRVPVFQPILETVGEIELNEIQNDFSEDYFVDWIQSMQFSVRSNAAFEFGLTSSMEENLKLGRLLSRLNELQGVRL